MKLQALAISLLSTVAAAQSVVSIGPDGRGCDGSAPTLLGDNSVASALASFDYDAVTGQLHLTISNTTPIRPNIPDAVITRVYFNAPVGAADGAVLISQVSSGGAAPNFSLGFDPNAGDASNPNLAGCFGNFNFRLAAPGSNLGIANPLTDEVCALKNEDWVLGPVTFTIQLSGPGIHGLSSEAFAASTSRLALSRNAAVAVKFDAAACGTFGTLASDEECRTAVFLRGSANIGETIDICVTGSNGCGAQLGVSLIPGPTYFKEMTVPIGVPVVALFPLGNFIAPTTEFCVPLTIPLDQSFIGLTLYWANVTNPLTSIDDFSFSEAFEFTIGANLP